MAVSIYLFGREGRGFGEFFATYCVGIPVRSLAIMSWRMGLNLNWKA